MLFLKSKQMLSSNAYANANAVPCEVQTCALPRGQQLYVDIRDRLKKPKVDR